MGLIEFLIAILILIVVVYALHLLISMLELPPQAKTLIYLIVAVVVLVVALRYLGVVHTL